MTKWTISTEEARCGRCGVAIVAGEPFQAIDLPGVVRRSIRCWDDRIGEFEPAKYEADLDAAWLQIYARRRIGHYEPLRYLPPRRRLPRDGKMLACGSDA